MIQAPDPFFTNDAIGFIKLMGTVFTAMALGLGAVWKMVHGPIQTQITNVKDHIDAVDDNLKRDVNALGSKVGEHHTRHEKHATEYQLLTGRVAAVELEQKYLREAVAEFRTVVSDFRDTSVENKTEIVGEVSRQVELVRTEVREVRERMIALNTRIDAREELKVLVQEMVKRA